MIKINPSIFRDYDIRGIYPTDLNEDTYYILGKASARYLKVPLIALGHDGRNSSPSLFEAFIRGATEMGTDVVDLGLISTEMLYFASGHYQFPASAIISASHNPGQYNGLKMVLKNVVPLHGNLGFPEIKELALSQNFPPASKKGKVTLQSIIDDWSSHILTFVNTDTIKPLKVAIDAGNGMGGLAWDKLKDKLPLEIIPLYFEPDGNFPHHIADPLKEENMVDLKKAVLENKADLGIAHDGDSDRMFAVDEKGEILSGTITSAILSEHLLKKNGPGTVLYNVVCGKIVPETITANGGTPLRVRVGHSFTKETMKKTNALFAGEHSGHFYFRQNYFADSSTIAAILLIEYLSLNNLKASEAHAKFNRYADSGEKNFKVKNITDAVKKIKDASGGAVSTDEIDGLSVWYPTYWFNLRQSKTEPLLRLNLEADTQEIMDGELKRLTEIIVSS
ncbi:hypothetical protein A3D77_03560 [Candidatus Gottesmanbacteria bacterium RIFCSPHIGHO2_02_FULL_39_11]|uniref:Phosphomannomutase/phosphoglucomutase n=1 Tax=Candidatus Gottesmanbacteria bacterium RIFCSPHIGHO2_02_FULL_39_11 TaxID=1798382 RepID=A0A1F5ZPC3_9BACT|nr:MAG: hypothetical protein A3D77_03560 [Candidatus Gottesmanbacteria bacterium RIFCSPHIGHO2_02_FULL_39_11]